MDKRVPPMTPATQVLEVLSKSKPTLKKSKSKKVIQKPSKIDAKVLESMQTIAQYKIWQKDCEKKRKTYMAEVKKAEAVILKYFSSDDNGGEVEIPATTVGLDGNSFKGIKFAQRVAMKKPRWSENIFIDAYNDFKRDYQANPEMVDAANIFYTYVEQKRSCDVGKPKVELSACLRTLNKN